MCFSKVISGLDGLVKGVRDAKVDVATGYPGRPITEIIERLSKEKEINHVEWSVNEKQAVSVAYGASLQGIRAISVMKHVGVNVASDAIIGSAINGINGGLVFFFGDDPGGFSSTNEQDSRHYAPLFNIPMFEPASPFEAIHMVKIAFELSEKLKVPTAVRYVNDFLNSKEIQNNYRDVPKLEIPKLPSSICAESPLPVNINQKHRNLRSKLDYAGSFLSHTAFNRAIEESSPQATTGIISSGKPTGLVKSFTQNIGEPIPHFQLGLIHPFLKDGLGSFLLGLGKLIVVEEEDPYIEEKITRFSPEVEVIGKLSGDIPWGGRIESEDIERAYERAMEKSFGKVEPKGAPSPMEIKWNGIEGCPVKKAHDAINKAIDPIREDLTLIGDTGCVGWGHMEPYRTVDNILCMGVSVSVASGINLTDSDRKAVAIMGDSSFFHSGIQSLLNASHNGHRTTFIIIDNKLTGETGGQSNPGSGEDILGRKRERIMLEELVKASQVDSWEVIEVEELDDRWGVIKDYILRDELNAIILRGSCPDECFK